MLRLPRPTLFPYTTLFRSRHRPGRRAVLARHREGVGHHLTRRQLVMRAVAEIGPGAVGVDREVAISPGRIGLRHHLRLTARSEEHTSELQSPDHLVCRLLSDATTPATHTLSLHDALPISSPSRSPCRPGSSP